jgi:hypothetical protein
MTIKSTLKSAALAALLDERKLKLVSTETQLANGTIALAGKIRKQPVSYKITASGAVLSNEFVARRVAGYKQGIQAVAELAAKRAIRLSS